MLFKIRQFQMPTEDILRYFPFQTDEMLMYNNQMNFLIFPQRRSVTETIDSNRANNSLDNAKNPYQGFIGYTHA